MGLTGALRARAARARARLRDHLGHRGDMLVTLGLAWVVIGISVVSAPDDGVAHVHEMLPMPVRVALWVVPGVLAVAVAVRGFDRPAAWVQWVTRGHLSYPAALAFSLLVFAPAIRALSYGVSWAVYLLPPPLDGDPRGWVYAAVWTLVARLTRIAAGWEDRPKRRRDVGRTR